jgi:hypothetical protein
MLSAATEERTYLVRLPGLHPLGVQPRPVYAPCRIGGDQLILDSTGEDGAQQRHQSPYGHRATTGLDLIGHELGDVEAADVGQPHSAQCRWCDVVCDVVLITGKRGRSEALAAVLTAGEPLLGVLA